MAQAAVAARFTGARLQPIDTDKTAINRPVNLAPATIFPTGAVITPISAAANDVQTVTVTGTPSSGSFTLSGVHPLTGNAWSVVIPFDRTVVQSQALINAAIAASATPAGLPYTSFGTGLITVGGGTLPGSAQTFTAAGAAVAMPIPLMTAVNNLGGGSTPAVGIVHTTVGARANTFGLYGTQYPTVAPPVAPTLSADSTTATYGAGTHIVEVTFLTALGYAQVDVSPGVGVLLDEGGKLLRLE